MDVVAPVGQVLRGRRPRVAADRDPTEGQAAERDPAERDAAERARREVEVLELDAGDGRGAEDLREGHVLQGRARKRGAREVRLPAVRQLERDRRERDAAEPVLAQVGGGESDPAERDATERNASQRDASERDASERDPSERRGGAGLVGGAADRVHRDGIERDRLRAGLAQRRAGDRDRCARVAHPDSVADNHASAEQVVEPRVDGPAARSDVRDLRRVELRRVGAWRLNRRDLVVRERAAEVVEVDRRDALEVAGNSRDRDRAVKHRARGRLGDRRRDRARGRPRVPNIGREDHVVERGVVRVSTRVGVVVGDRGRRVALARDHEGVRAPRSHRQRCSEDDVLNDALAAHRAISGERDGLGQEWAGAQLAVAERELSRVDGESRLLQIGANEREVDPRQVSGHGRRPALADQPVPEGLGVVRRVHLLVAPVGARQSGHDERGNHAQGAQDHPAKRCFHSPLPSPSPSWTLGGCA